MRQNTSGGAVKAFRLGFRARVTGLLVLAAAAPLAVLARDGHSWLFVAAALLSAACAIVADRLVAPFDRVINALPDPADTSARGVADQVDRVLAEIAALNARGAGSAPTHGLVSKTDFQNAVGAIIQGCEDPAILGVVRFDDYDGLAAFDPAAADRALATFSARLLDLVAAGRMIGQVDRNCFAVWFAGAADPTELQSIAYVLSQEFTDGDLTLSPKVALGAARFPEDGAEPGMLLTRAMGALNDGGKAASGKPAFFSPQASEGARRRFELVQESRRALTRNQFSLHYQPVIDLTQSRVVGAEALIRWTHPTLGAISPAEFVPIVEQAGLMEETGLWVLNTACREAREWRDQGLENLKMAVNLSPVQCRNPQLAEVIVRTLERHGLAPENLELELTETAAMEDEQAIRALLAKFKALGLSLAIDDFGAGYSSLTYLKNLPFSKLKIDREFVTRVDERTDSQAICSALIALARGLDIQVLAEGVERREELETLRSLGCPLIQGYYFSKPLPAAEFVRTITDPAWLALLASPVHRQRAMIQTRAVQ